VHSSSAALGNKIDGLSTRAAIPMDMMNPVINKISELSREVSELRKVTIQIG
jgi:hypothetical protein